MSLIRRDMAAALVSKPEGAAADSRVRTVVISSEAVDSYNTTLSAKGWDFSTFTRNPIVLFNHNHSEPIGKGSNLRQLPDGRTVADVEFFTASINPMADRAMGMLDSGVGGSSVGFDGLEYNYNQERETGDEWRDMFNPPLDFTSQVLYEFSIVSVPANPDALPLGRSIESLRDRVPLAALRAPRKKKSDADTRAALAALDEAGLKVLEAASAEQPDLLGGLSLEEFAETIRASLARAAPTMSQEKDK